MLLHRFFASGSCRTRNPDEASALPGLPLLGPFVDIETDVDVDTDFGSSGAPAGWSALGPLEERVETGLSPFKKNSYWDPCPKLSLLGPFEKNGQTLRRVFTVLGARSILYPLVDFPANKAAILTVFRSLFWLYFRWHVCLGVVLGSMTIGMVSRHSSCGIVKGAQGIWDPAYRISFQAHKADDVP